MKRKILNTLLVLFSCFNIIAQAPQKMSYQAVIRNSTGNLITNTNVGVQVNIHQGSPSGTQLFTETHSVTTNSNGLMSFEIGTIMTLNIDWANGPYFLEVQTDPNGGSNYTITGVSELLSVPYALHAKTSEDAFSGDYNDLINTPTNVSSFTNDAGYLSSFTEIDGSVTNEIQSITRSNDTIYLSQGGFITLPAGFDGQYSSLIGAPTTVSSFTNDAGYITSFTEIDGSTTNEIQVLSISADTIYLTNGGFVKLPAGFDGQYSSLSGAPTNISSFINNVGYLISEIDGSTTNEIQVLSISADTIYLTNGGFVKLPAGFDGQYSSLTGAPTNISAFTNNVGYLTSEIDGSITNEIQVLSISADTVYLTNGGFVKLPASNAWSLNGNSGTNPGTDFIGTTDTEDLVIKTDNTEKARITASGNVGIGTNSPEAILDISSKTSGILIPRMTTAERDLIAAPSLGLQIYNITTKCFNVWNGSAWGQICPDCGFVPVAGNNGPICAGLTLNLTAATIPGATYQWTGPNGFTSTDQNPAIANASLASSGVYYVTATKNGCTSLESSTVVTINPSLGTTSVSYTAPACVNYPLNLFATTIPGASYTWSGPNNYFSNIQNPVIPSATLANAGTYNVSATVGGCTSSASVTVSISGVSAQPGTITGTFGILAPANGITYSISPVSGATSYTWTYSGTGATIHGQGTNSITIDFACGATNGSLSVTANNACGGSSAPQAQAVTMSTLAQPDAITGLSQLTPPQFAVAYNTNPVAGATSYTWTIPASLGTIVSGQGTTAITVDFTCGASSGVISVMANNACGSSIARTKTVAISGIGTPGAITGLTSITYPLNGVAYSVAPVAGATSYVWTVPSGAVIASGQGSNSISVNYACGSLPGNLTVSAINPCGTSGANSVSISITTSTPPMPGAISGANNVPAGIAGMTYSISNVSGATSYVWTVPSGVTITSGQGTNAITVSYMCSAVSGNIGVSAVNDCGTSSQRTFAVTVTPAPAQPAAITGISSVPLGATGVSYSVPTVTGATIYTWSFTGTGATIVSGQGTNTVIVDFNCAATNGNIVVNASNTCAVQSADRTLGVTFIGTVPTPGAITGISNPLFGQVGTTYSVTPVSGATTYTWTAPAGATIASGQGTNAITVDFGCAASNGNISVVAGNGCAANSAPSNKAITLGNTIAQPGVITGTASVAQGVSGITYTIAPVTGATTYAWTYTGSGVTFGSGQGTTSVTVNYACNATSGNISVTASNTCVGPSVARTFAVTVNGLATPGAITGPTSVAQGSTGISYTIAAVPGATTYNWIVPIGATVVSGQGTTSALVDFGCTVGSGNILVTAVNACGSSGGSSLNVAISGSLPAAPGIAVATMGTNIPKGTNNVIYGVSSVLGATSYTWTLPSGGTIVSGQGTTTILTNFSCNAVSGNLTVVANNGCGSSSPTTYPVNIQNAPQPGGISGTTSVPKGSTGMVYTCGVANGATNYTWTVPNGAFIVSGQGTTSIVVDYACNSTSGNISVTANNTCGIASSPNNLAITVSNSLASLGIITGTTSPLVGQSNVTYSVAAISGASNYAWSVPSGANIITGQGTPAITVDFSCAASNGSIVVSANNGCLSTTPVSLSFALSSVALALPGGITGSTSVPKGTPSVTYSITSVSGATSYIWTVPANAVILSGQGTTSINVDFSSCSVASGNIGVTASNGCVPNSPERTLAVTVTTTSLPTPGAITGTQTPVFGANNVSYSITPVVGAAMYTWSYSGTGVTIVSGQGTNSITVNYACAATNGNMQVTASNGCVATSATQISAITLSSNLPAPSVVVGNQSPILGQINVTYAAPNVTGATSYLWTVSPGATIVSGQGTNAIVVDFSCTAQTNGTISLVAQSACGLNSTPTALSYVMGGSMANPGAIAGITTVPKGTAGVAYNITHLASATTYNWSVPVGTTIVSGQGTPNIVLDYDCAALNGTISVNATNGCATSANSTQAITISNTLATPGIITGNATPVFGSTANYSVIPVLGATSYNWTLPAGASIVSGAGTNFIQVLFDCTASAGNISVTVNNTCIIAGTASSKAITPVAGSSLGTLGPISQGTVAGLNTRSYTVASIGTANYVWTVPAGMTIVSGQGSPSIIVSYSAAITGVVSVTAQNTCLSQSNASTLNINLNPGIVFAATGTGQYGTLQTWTVPAGVTQVTIEAAGAQGGGIAYTGWGTRTPSKGAKIKGTISVTPGQAFTILVGQSGSTGSYSGGGGGGSFITTQNLPLLIAGGGAGTSYYDPLTGGQITENGGGSESGTNGNGGGCSNGSSAGGGFYSNGTSSSAEGGKSFISGAFGGNAGFNGSSGGYGGGGGSYYDLSGGAGGGYSGGGGYYNSVGGGGSYNSGSNQNNQAGTNSGNGYVIISW